MKRKTLKIATISLMILMGSGTVSAEGDDDPSVELGPCIGYVGCESLPEINPSVRTNLDFELRDCTGVKEKITEDEWTVVVGGAKGGPLIVGFAYLNYKTTDKGWSWQFTCVLEFTDDVYADGDGSFLREVAIYADTPSGQYRAEGNCYYDGIIQSGCRTPTIIENGDEYVITVEGMTNGYPSETSAEAQAAGVNKPADAEEICVNEHHGVCLDYPSAAQLVDPRVAKHAPVKSDAAEIKWTSASEFVDDMAGIPDLEHPGSGLV